jgi:CPA2 family monovalent cation:H+ antiporter-2
MRQLLALYESWLEGLRERPPETQHPPWHRGLRALVLDAVGLLIWLGVAVTWMQDAVEHIEDILRVKSAPATAIAMALIALISLPLVRGLYRNTRAVALLASEALLPGASGAPTPATRLALRASRLLVVMVVVLAVGTPAMAIMRPITGHAYGAGLMGLLVLGIGFHLWRTAGRLDVAFRSGAETVAALVARQGSSPTESEHEPTLLPGLDRVVGIPVGEGWSAMGRSLAELDLRAKTGATVVAIQRAGSRVVLPTGHERLELGDVLAMVGTHEAIALARSLLRGSVG